MHRNLHVLCLWQVMIGMAQLQVERWLRYCSLNDSGDAFGFALVWDIAARIVAEVSCGAGILQLWRSCFAVGFEE